MRAPCRRVLVPKSAISTPLCTKPELVSGHRLPDVGHDSVDARNRHVLERLRRRQRDVRSGDPNHRPVEIPERLVGDDRCDLRSPSAQARVLFDGERPAGLGDRAQDGSVSSGTSVRRSITSAEMPSAASCSGGFESTWAPSVPEPRSCSPCPPARRLPARAASTCSPSGTSPFDGEQGLVLEEHHGIRVTDGCGHQPHDVGGSWTAPRP